MLCLPSPTFTPFLSHILPSRQCVSHITFGVCVVNTVLNAHARTCFTHQSRFAAPKQHSTHFPSRGKGHICNIVCELLNNARQHEVAATICNQERNAHMHHTSAHMTHNHTFDTMLQSMIHSNIPSSRANVHAASQNVATTTQHCHA